MRRFEVRPLCRCWIIPSTTTGTIQGSEEELLVHSWEHKYGVHLPHKEYAECSQAAEEQHNTKHKYKLPYNPKETYRILLY